MGVFNPIWMTDNKKKEAKAIEYVQRRIDDDETLLRVIKLAKFNAIKVAAAKKLNTDAARLCAVLERTGVFEQEAALSSLSDKSLIDGNIYFSIIEETTRTRVIDELSDESLLNEIVQRDPSPRCRLQALKKTSNEQIALSALRDKDKDVRGEAVFHIYDNDILVEYLVNHGSTPSGRKKELMSKIDSFTTGQLRNLLDGNLDDVFGDVKRYACGRLGHQPGKNCRCVRCGTRMEHEFNENGVCQNCGARQILERETLEIMREAYGYRDNLVIVYPDGTRETVKEGEEVVTADESKMKWLLSDY